MEPETDPNSQTAQMAEPEANTNAPEALDPVPVLGIRLTRMTAETETAQMATCS